MQPEHRRPVLVRTFEPHDRDAARRIIVDGLAEHFGFVDEEVNADLDDIGASYAGNLFLVAECDGVVAGTGALVLEGEGIARIVRMSVRQDVRRRGIASRILESLLDGARSKGCWRVVLETGDWADSVGFYLDRRFRQTSHDERGPNMALDL